MTCPVSPTPLCLEVAPGFCAADGRLGRQLEVGVAEVTEAKCSPQSNAVCWDLGLSSGDSKQMSRGRHTWRTLGIFTRIRAVSRGGEEGGREHEALSLRGPPTRVSGSCSPSWSHRSNLRNPSRFTARTAPHTHMHPYTHMHARAHVHAHTPTRAHTYTHTHAHTALLGSSPPQPAPFLFPREPRLSGRSRDTSFLCAHHRTEKVSVKCRRHGHARTLCRTAQSTSSAPGPQPRTRWAGRKAGCHAGPGRSVFPPLAPPPQCWERWRGRGKPRGMTCAGARSCSSGFCAFLVIFCPFRSL